MIWKTRVESIAERHYPGGVAISEWIPSRCRQDILVLSILGVRREYLEAAFNELHHHFGGIKEYFARGLGIDRAGQQAIRQQFITYA